MDTWLFVDNIEKEWNECYEDNLLKGCFWALWK